MGVLYLATGDYSHGGKAPCMVDTNGTGSVRRERPAPPVGVVRWCKNTKPGRANHSGLKWVYRCVYPMLMTMAAVVQAKVAVRTGCSTTGMGAPTGSNWVIGSV